MYNVLLTPLLLAPLALGQQLYGRALPSSVQAPSTAGFQNATVQPSRGGASVCVSGYINISATSSKNAKFNFTSPTNQTSTTDVFLEMVTSGSPFMEQIMAGMQTVSGNYTLGATLCTPAGNTKPEKIQLLTHGIGFDRHYWDFAPGYSYVDTATANGYATFSYDRLGVGESSRPDPLNVVQTSLEVEIAAAIGRKIQSGSYGGISCSTIVGVGHSFGSVISQAVTAEYPKLFDAVILTGFSVNTSFPAFLLGGTFQIASQNNPYRFSNLPAGYLVGGSLISTQINFARTPNFDPSILALAYATGGTVTFGELFTISSVTMAATNYTGALAVVDGDNDLPFCMGNCSYPTDHAAQVAPMLYPNVAKNKTGSFLLPGTGHGINLHYTAPLAFTFIEQFLSSQGM